MYSAIGAIEFSSVSRGIYTADQMLKAADVEPVTCNSICPGKYIALIQGDVAAVEDSIRTGERLAGEYLLDSFILPNVHPGIFPAITATTMPEENGALGILETFSLSCLISAADAALKAAAIYPVELRLGAGLGGKAYFIFTGDVAAVSAALDAGKALSLENGPLVNTELIPSPSVLLWQSLL